MIYHTSPSYSVSVRLSMEQDPTALGLVTTEIGKQGGLIGAISIISVHKGRMVRELTVQTHDEAHEQRIADALDALPGVKVLSVKDLTFAYHEGGKIRVCGTREPLEPDELAIAYTPGVGRVSLSVAESLDRTYRYTIKGNSVAVVTDGTAVLGLGNIGPMGALPVMEGKALLFKKFAGINAFPICLDVTDPDAVVEVVKAISPGFGAINLEDISAPRCFEIEDRLKRELTIPVFHDDQHGTAIAILSAIHNALSVVDKRIDRVKIVISGVGAAGVACARLLLHAGATDVISCDRSGTLYAGREEHMNPVKQELAEITNPRRLKGDLRQALADAGVFIGVSAGNLLEPSDLKTMSSDPIVFALANPTPEVDPDGARRFARVVATGRSDYPNQINNALVFPGVFRGALDARVKEIDEAMCTAAARALAHMVPREELREDYIIPDAFHPGIAESVAAAVQESAQKRGA